MDCPCDMSGSGKKKKEKGGLIYMIAVDPSDFIHLVHNGCDNGFELFKISTRRQLLEDAGEVEARVVEEYLHQHLLQDLGADCARLVSQLLWDPFPELLESRHHALEEQSKLGAGLEVLVEEYPKPAKSSCASSSSMVAAILTRPSVQSSTVALTVF